MEYLKTKTIKSALIAGAGAALTYLLQAATQSDFGMYTPIVVGTLSVLVNFVKELNVKYMEDDGEEIEDNG